MFFQSTTRIHNIIIFLFLNFIIFTFESFSQTDTSQSILITSDSLKTDSEADSLMEETKDPLSIQDDILSVTGIDTTNLFETKTDPAILDTTAFLFPSSTIRDTILTLEPEGYRGVLWGMTFDESQTKLIESDNLSLNELFQTKNGFEFTHPINDRPTLITYQFDNDRLFIARLLPRIFSKRKADYVEAFDEYYETLFQKYGTPTREGFLKKDKTYQNTIEAIILGYAKRYAIWDFKRTQLILLMKGIIIGDPLKQKRGLQITITYSSKMIMNEIKERRSALKQEEF